MRPALLLLFAGLLYAGPGEPINDVGIGLGKHPTPHNNIVAKVRTDASGVFRIVDVPPGTYTLEASMPPDYSGKSPRHFNFRSSFNGSRSNIKTNVQAFGGSASLAPTVLSSGPSISNDVLQVAGAILPGQPILFSEDITITAMATLTGIITAEDVNVSTTALRFVAIEGGSPPAAQTLRISSTSDNRVAWSAAFSSDARTPSWRAGISLSSDSLATGTGDDVQVQPAVAGLAPGVYLGQIKIAFQDGTRAFDRVVAVTLVVLARNDSVKLPISVDRKMDFAPLIDAVNYDASTITVTNIGPSSQSYSVTPLASDQGNESLISPAAFTLAPGASQAVRIQWRISANPKSIATLAASAKDCVTISRSDETSFTYYQLPADTTHKPLLAASAAGGNVCQPTRLFPVITQLDASAVTGHALNGTLQVYDDCGNQRLDYTAQIAFGDPSPGGVQEAMAFSPAGRAVKQTGVNNSSYKALAGASASIKIGDPAFAIAAPSAIKANWDLKQNKGNLTVSAKVTDALTGSVLTGVTTLDVPIEYDPAAPYISNGGVISAASFEPVGVAPGEIASVFGLFPGAALAAADRVPLPVQVSGLSLELDGKPMPLFFASEGQINGIIPFGTAPGMHSVTVKQANPPFTSAPVEVNVVGANPAHFVTDGSGAGQAHIYKIANGRQILVDADNPAQEGDTLVMYVSGLGDIDAPLTTGDQAPLVTLPSKAPVKVRIGGNDATVLYAGLTPGSVSLYQINVLTGPISRPPTPPGFLSTLRFAATAADIIALPVEIDAGGALSGADATGYFVTTQSQKINVSFVTSPVALSILVNKNVVVGSSGLLTFDAGTPISIDVPNPVQVSGANADIRYRFAGWSQSGPTSQTIAPTVSVAFAAYFTTEIKLTTSTTQGATVTSITPASSDGFYTAGTQLTITGACPAGSVALSAVDSHNAGIGLTSAANPVKITLNTPVTVQFTCLPSSQTIVNTNPANVGLSVIVDGKAFTDLATYTPTPGSAHTHSTTTPQLVNGTQYAFTGWTPGTTALTQTVTGASTNATYTANFRVSGYQVTTSGCGVNVGPASQALAPNVFPAGAALVALANPIAGQALQSITVTIGGVTTSYTTSPASFTLTGPATITGTCATQITACITAPVGLIAWYPLDETQSPALDIAPGGAKANATWVGSPVSVAGIVGKAMSFGASQFVEAVNSAEADIGTGDFSIDAWIQASPSVGVTTFVDKRELSGGARGYSFYLVNGNLGFQMADKSASSSSCSLNPSNSSCTNWGTTVQIADGKWHLVAATVSRASKTGGTLYVDGNPVLTFDPTIRALSLSNAGKLRIGGGLDSDFGGSVDEVEIFNRVLTAADVQMLVAARSFGKCKPGGQNVNVTVQTSFGPGLTFSVDGSEFTSPQTVSWVPGSAHLVSTTSPQVLNGTQYTFAGWTGLTGTSTTQNVLAPLNPTTYTANFNASGYQLAVTVNPPNSCSYALNPPLPANGIYPINTSVTITATANAGAAFTGYSGTLTSAQNPFTFTMNAPQSLTVNCGTAPNVTLTVATNPAGLLARIGAGAYSAAPISQQVPANQTQSISVQDPQFVSATGTGYSFTGWSTGGSTATTNVNPSANLTATATFKIACYALTLNVLPAGSGTISANPAGGGIAGFPSNCYAPGTAVTLTATGASGNVFQSWTGATGATGTTTITMNAAATVTANFVPPPILTVFLQSRSSGTGNLAMGVRNTGGSAATNVTVTSISAITSAGATLVYTPGLLVIPFVIPGAATLNPGTTSGFNSTFTATSGNAGAPFSFAITVKADNVAPFTTTINVP